MDAQVQQWAELNGFSLEAAERDLYLMKFFFPGNEKASAPTETSNTPAIIISELDW